MIWNKVDGFKEPEDVAAGFRYQHFGVHHFYDFVADVVGPGFELVSLGYEKIAVLTKAEVKIAIHGFLKMLLSQPQIVQVLENQLLNLLLFLEKKLEHGKSSEMPKMNQNDLRCPKFLKQNYSCPRPAEDFFS
jgi:hypothetical protein